MKKILLLTTGGTIASGESGGGLAPVLSSEDFLQYVKEFEGKCELHPREVCSIDSTNMRPEYWQLLVRTIREAYEEYDAPRHGYAGIHCGCALLYDSGVTKAHRADRSAEVDLI